MKQISTIIIFISLITIQLIAAEKSYKIDKDFKIINDSTVKNKQLLLEYSYIYFIDTTTNKYELLDKNLQSEKINFSALDKEKDNGIFMFYSPYGIDTIIPFQCFLSNDTLLIKVARSTQINPYFKPIHNNKFSIKGTVIDDTGEAAIGATVKIPGTSIRTLTDFNGFFEIKDIPNGPTTLEYIYIGFKTHTQEIYITNDTTINITLTSERKEDYNEHSEIQIRVVKPAIYLYPTQEEEISIQLDFKGNLGTTFPKYKNGWTVKAKTNGELINLADNRRYNYLFWEGDNSFPESHFNYKDGFVISKNKAEQFLIDKLSILGLNNTEINDFIVYWLPQLEKNEYNLIHFFVNDNIDNSAFLDVKPKPDTQIRVFMEFKAVDKDYKIKEQQLPKIERKGFTLVEWGGGIIGSGKIE